jgi:hypothetical protein
MTAHAFVEALRQELARRGFHFDPAEVGHFVAAEWAGIEQDPDPWSWAHQFLIRGYPGSAG